MLAGSPALHLLPAMLNPARLRGRPGLRRRRRVSRWRPGLDPQPHQQ